MSPANVCLCLAVLVGLTGCKTKTEYRSEVQARCTRQAEAITVHREPDKATQELAVRRMVRRCMAEAGEVD